MKGGEVFDDWAKEISQFARAKTDDPDLGSDFERLGKALNGLIKIRRKYGEAAKGKNINLIPLTSLTFLHCMAEITISKCFLEQAIIAREKLSEGKDTAFYQGKILTAKHYLRNFLPLVFGRFEVINLEDFSPIEIPEEAIV